MFLIFFLELVGFSIRIFLGSVTFLVLLEPRNLCYFQRLFYRAVLFTKYAVLPNSHFYIPKKLTTPLFFSQVRQVFNNCQIAIAYKVEVGFYITCLINKFEF